MLDVYHNETDKLILWRMHGPISIKEMISATRAFTVDTDQPAYDHVTIVDAREAKEPRWSLNDLFDLAHLLHEAFTANKSHLNIYILVETDWKRGEASLFRSVARMSGSINVNICHSELELLTKANLLTKTTRIDSFFPTRTLEIRA